MNEDNQGQNSDKEETNIDKEEEVKSGETNPKEYDYLLTM